MIRFLWHGFIKLSTALSWIVATFVFVPLCCLVALLPASVRYDSRLYFGLVYWWNLVMVRGAFLKLNIVGAEHLPMYPNNPAVIVANHASNYDIYLLEVLMQGYPHVWLSKESYLKVPFFGFLVQRLGVPVDRQNAFKAGKALLKAYNLVHQHARHLVLFPEGTRFDDGKIHDFHSGFAVLAKKLGRPVVPVYVSGLNTFMPKRNWLVNPEARVITVIIGKPVFCGQDELPEAFSVRIQDWFCKNLKST